MNKYKNLGLKKGTVELFEHEKSWEEYALELISFLKIVFDKIALDIQHIGSTSIKSIKAKPIIDIIVGVADLTILDKLEDKLFVNNIVFHPLSFPGDIVLVFKDNEDDVAPKLNLPNLT